MQWVAKAVQYYKDINPATLTGAIDVIVVERPTTDGGVELACSPFHVRFGKLSVLRPIDKKVRITVNDERIPFYMKVGETGEAFFVFETDADVPEDLQTSPLAGPMMDEDMLPVEGEDDAPGEPEFLDLGASETAVLDDEELDEDGNPLSSSTSPTSSRYASMNQTRLSSPAQAMRPLPPLTPRLSAGGDSDLRFTSATISNDDDIEDETHDANSAGAHKGATLAATIALDAAEKAAALGKAVLSTVGGVRDKKLLNLLKDANSHAAEGEDDHPHQRTAALELDQLERSMRQDLEGVSLGPNEGRDAPNQAGDEVRKAARENEADLRREYTAMSARPLATGSKLDEADYFGAAGELGHGPEMSGDLMLDMSGYKIEDEPESAINSALRRADEGMGTPTEINGPIDERAEAEMVAFTQGLLSSVDPRTLRGFFDPADSEPSSSRASPLPTPSDLSEGKLARPRITSPLGSSQSLPHDIPSTNGEAESAIASLSSVEGLLHASNKQFLLRVGGKVIVFELSLCGGDDFGHNRMRDVHAFIEQQVTFNQFIEDEEITTHSNLVVKYAERYLTWDNASPVLASLAVYRKSLVDHPDYHNAEGEAGSEELEVDVKRSRGWTLWWNKKGAASTVSLPTQDTTVQPPSISRPSSPQSLPLPNSPEPVSPLAGPTDISGTPEVEDKRHYAKTLRLTSDQLKTLGLKKGMNVISFSVRSSYSGFATCTSRIFLWESDFQVVISDIDGTITKSDALGHVFTMIGRDWTHLGVAKLYTDIARNGYKMMYLTSRAIGQADTTREYLKGIKQNGYQLPEGPVIMSPDRLMTSLHREVIMRKPEVFKMACLRDIKRLFGDRSPFHCGFGNRITDALSYRAVDIPSSRIFTIDTNGEVKMELLELAGYKSSYIHMTDLVDQMFPPINRKTQPDFTDFNFWRQPVQSFELPDLSPPSPALSARSDGSRIGLARLGSIANSLSRRSSRATLVDGSAKTTRGATPSSPLLQATVVEEGYGYGDDDDLDDPSESASMPGSLPNDSDFERLRAKHLQSEAEAYKAEVTRDGEEDDEEDEGEEEEEEGEEDFGDQMDFSSVPYL